MVLDYHERKQVSKNRPKKRPLKFVFILAAGVILVVFSLGVATGWFLNKARRVVTSVAPENIADNTGKKSGEAVRSSDNQQMPQNGKGNINDPHLTFYDTLPKGEVTALGSGLNPAPVNKRPATESPKSEPGNTRPANQKQEQKHQTTVSTRNNEKREQSAATESATAPVSAEKSQAGDKGDKKSASDKTQESAKKYTVQAASCSVKKDAEAMKEALDKKGLLSYVVESKIPGKGTWYRVRLGNHLDRETANKIAAKVGKNAILIPE
jgi:cell division protein FtsN